MWENKGYEDRGRMSIDTPFRGSLFANDFLCESIIGSPDWQAAGMTETLYDVDWIAELVQARDPKPGPYRKRKASR